MSADLKYKPIQYRKKIMENEDDLLVRDKPAEVPISPMHLPSLMCIMFLGFIANVEYGVIMPSVSC